MGPMDFDELKALVTAAHDITGRSEPPEGMTQEQWDELCDIGLMSAVINAGDGDAGDCPGGEDLWAGL